MSKYTSYSRPKPKPKPQGVHPLMRGIGCILMVIVPILSYGLATLLVPYGVSRGWPLPPNWFGPPSIPPLLMKVQGLQRPLQFLQAQTNLEVNLVVTLILIVIIGGIMSMIYGYIYTLFGPPKYGPQDAPPIRVKVKRYKR